MDVEFPDGSRASGLAKLPPDIADQFKELQRLDARYGGRFAASGTLNAGGSSAALSILSIVFAAAGLPTEYPAARLVLWLKKAGIYEKVTAYLQAQGTSLRSELLDMYVSDVLAAAVLDAKPEYAPSTSAVLDRFLANYPQVERLTDEIFVAVLEETIKELHGGQVPLTLLVLDELQLFLGDDPQKTWEMQQLVEAMCGKLGSRLLVVGAGQLSLRATANLQRLQDRFKVEVALRDADVNRVVQSVVLKKKPACEKEIATVLDRARGEIARQFGGSAIQFAAQGRGLAGPGLPAAAGPPSPHRGGRPRDRHRRPVHEAAHAAPGRARCDQEHRDPGARQRGPARRHLRPEARRAPRAARSSPRTRTTSSTASMTARPKVR